MKKRGMLLALLVSTTLLGGCITTGPSSAAGQDPAPQAAQAAAQAEEEDGGTQGDTRDKTVKIGYTVQDLTNPIWTAQVNHLVALCEAEGWEISVLDCAYDSGKQITQVENFMTGGADVIIIAAADPNAIGDVCQAAREKGVLLLSAGQLVEEVDVSMINDNYLAGYLVGVATGEWLTERYGAEDTLEVALYEYPFVQEGIDRTEGMMAGLAEAAPNAEVVSTANAANVTDGMSSAETILQANPDVKAFMCFGDGGALGVCEVMEAKGLSPEDYGIFSIDGTDECLAKIQAGTPFRMSVSLGSAEEMAGLLFQSVSDLLSGEYEEVYYTPTTAIYAANVDEYLA